MNALILLLSEQGVGYHLHVQFVGAFIYADDVTLLAHTSIALNVMLETCSNFVSDFDLQFNSSETKCMYFSRNNTDEHDKVYFMNTPIEFMKSTQLLGVHISNDITNMNITSSVHKYYARDNRVLCDFRIVPCHVKATLLSTYCSDLYGSQLWNFSSIDVQPLFVSTGVYGSCLTLLSATLMIAFQ